MTWLGYLGFYVAGFLLVQLLTWLGLRSEPTAHGHEVGTLLGCVIGLVWPLALVWIAIVGIGWLAWKAWSGVRALPAAWDRAFHRALDDALGPDGDEA